MHHVLQLPVEAQTGHCPLKETKIGKNFQSPLFNLCSVIAYEHSERTALAQMLQHTVLVLHPEVCLP